MFELRGCRACLNQDCKLERVSDATRRLYCTVTGLEFTPGDCYPSYLCVECSTQIKKILAFRRRCRRAFYVLKEIVAVRKTVTLSDLAAVDRKKTNLRSHVDFWQNNNIRFYSIVKNTEEDTDTKPSDIRKFLKEFEPQSEVDVKPSISQDKYTPEVINNTYIAVDIKPNNSQVTYDEVHEENQADDNCNTFDDDAVHNEALEDNVPNDIDLNDVFKDLPEEQDNDSDYSLPDLEPESETIKTYREKKHNKNEEKIKITKTKKEKPKHEVSAGTIDLEEGEKSSEACGMNLYKAFKFSRALTDFEIQLVSFEEQVEIYQLRRDTDPYKSAAFKCSICLITFVGMPELLSHLDLHNNKQKTLTREQRKKFYCVICKDTFSCQQELTAHSACKHWYKYQCKICHDVKYTLEDTVKCHGSPLISVSQYYTMDETFKMSEHTAELKVPKEKLEKTCRFCGMKVPRVSKLVTHELLHVDPPPNINRKRLYQCDMCGIWLRNKFLLESHMHMHYRVFACKMCGDVFDSWVSAHNHLKAHKKYKCPSCEETFPSEEDRRTHQLKSHVKKEATYDCTLCGEPIFSLFKLYYHQLQNHGYISINHSTLGDPNFRCTMCGVQFVDSPSLFNHQKQKRHIKNQKMLWTSLKGSSMCSCTCGQVFSTAEDYIAHRRTSQCKRYPTKCAYEFNSIVPVNGVTVFHCDDSPLAPSSCLPASPLPPTGSPPPCHQPQLAIVGGAPPPQLQLAVSHHGQHGALQEPQSSYAFVTIDESTAAQLQCDAILHNYRISRRHYEREHPDMPRDDRVETEQVICEHCGKQITKTSIYSHMRRHTKEDSTYTCYVCRAKISTSKAYVSHMLFNHTPKPYLCDLCPYRGKYRMECREHILKVHAPEMPYHCDTCGRRFSHLDLLHHHALKAHGINVKADRSIFLPTQETSGKMFVFPHMKIDGSLIDPAVIEDVTLYKYDFLCKTNEVVDYKDYFVFNTGVEPTILDPKVVKDKRRQKHRQKNIIRQNDEILLSGGTIVKQPRKRRRNADSGIEKAKKSKVDVGHNDEVFKAFDDQESKVEDNNMAELKEGENIVNETITDDKNAFKAKKPVNTKLGSKHKSDNAKFKINKEPTVAGPDMPQLDLLFEMDTGPKNVHSNKAKQKRDNIDKNPKFGAKNKVKTGNIPARFLFDKPNEDVDEDIKGDEDMDKTNEDVDEDMDKTQVEEVIKDEDNIQEVTVKAGTSDVAEDECIELDINTLLNENYQVIADEDGEQYVVINGICYRMQVGD